MARDTVSGGLRGAGGRRRGIARLLARMSAGVLLLAPLVAVPGEAATGGTAAQTTTAQNTTARTASGRSTAESGRQTVTRAERPSDRKADRPSERRSLPSQQPAHKPPASAETALPVLAADPLRAGRLKRLAAVRTWGYWLRYIDADTVRESLHDLIVVDFGVVASRRLSRARTTSEIEHMKGRAEGPPRIVLSYLSVGEAERYRPYWQPEWHDPARKPAWLGEVNPIWDGNFAVQYWHPDWQRLIFGAADSYLEMVIAQGFDGVYLDRADAFLELARKRPAAEAEMVAFLTALATHARRLAPGFLIVMQNAEELLRHRRILEAIDGIAKEDLFFGVGHTGQANSADDVNWSLKHLQLARKAGLAVLVVEYLAEPDRIATAARRALEAGFVPYIAPRGLECLNLPPVLAAPMPIPDRHRPYYCRQ